MGKFFKIVLAISPCSDFKDNFILNEGLKICLSLKNIENGFFRAEFYCLESDLHEICAKML